MTHLEIFTMLKTRTNNVPRFTLDAFELTPKERDDFDYLPWDAIEVGAGGATFVKFKGQLYDLGEFMRCAGACGMEGWDGYYSDSAFSGVLIKYVGNDADSVIVGQYFS